MENLHDHNKLEKWGLLKIFAVVSQVPDVAKMSVLLYLQGKVVYIYAIKAYGGLEVEISLILISALEGYVWSASLPGSFNPGKLF
jgi:hypothetical protein